MAQQDAEGVVDTMHQHRKLEGAGAVVDIAEKASDEECRNSLPEIAVDGGEEQGGDDYRQGRGDSLAVPAASVTAFAIVEKASEHESPAHPFLEQWRENPYADQTRHQRAAGHHLHSGLQLFRHFRQEVVDHLQHQRCRQHANACQDCKRCPSFLPEVVAVKSVPAFEGGVPGASDS